MSLLTTCPRCASQFRIHPEQLAAGGGWVQCGICGASFDARASLAPEEIAVVPPQPVEAAEVAASAASVEVPPPPAASAQTPALPAGVLNRQAATSQAVDLHSIILVDPDAPIPEEPEALPVMLPPPEPPTAAPLQPPASPAFAPAEAAAEAQKPPAAVSRRRGRRALGVLVALLLLLVLALQGAYFERDALVQNLPALRPALQQACGWLGCRLALPRDIQSLAIIGSELQVSARNSHAATLRVTLANQSASAQAWPRLRLNLQGLDGETRTSQVLTPNEYLDDAARLNPGLPAQSQYTARVDLTVKGAPLLAAQPYSLDIFY